ncbi:ECF transporter S component [Microaceticoccus formicicus]|uniref:ECF transporter S component n=1 Tax=Microaceticoccus formicicus TaxID=3118105 RepID=UPI003CD0117E|nr:ECF transporter S component [Peptoniphilaceae bacterium AMB_02]
MKDIKIRDLAYVGLSIALITLGTMVIQIPIPATSGYIHVGDGIILLVAVTFGAKYGLIAGGVGSALADIISGYTIWAPFTLIIKGIMGYAMGTVSKSDGQLSFTSSRSYLGSIIATVIMVFGYFVAGSFLTGTMSAALLSVPWNALQGLGGIVIYVFIGHLFEKVDIRKSIKWNK